MADGERAPGPWEIRDPAGFIARLQALKDWSGLTYRELSARAEVVGDSLPRSTVANMLTRATLPREELLITFVRACGAGPEETERWLRARKELAARTRVTPRPAPPHPTPDAGGATGLSGAGGTERGAWEPGAGGTGRDGEPAGDAGAGSRPGAYPARQRRNGAVPAGGVAPEGPADGMPGAPGAGAGTAEGAGGGVSGSGRGGSGAGGGVATGARGGEADSGGRPVDAAGDGDGDADAAGRDVPSGRPGGAGPGGAEPRPRPRRRWWTARVVVPVVGGLTLVVALTTLASILRGDDKERHRTEPAVTAPAPGPVRVRAVHSGLCLNERPGEQSGQVYQVECASADVPRYELARRGGGLWRIVSHHPDFGPGCSGIPVEAAEQDGAPLIDNECGKRGPSEAFRIEPVGDEPVRGHRIRAAHSGLCVTVPEASREAWTAVVQKPCAADGAGQLFSFD
ncbi:helix-turn-helix domain-containing protein [Streptomyces sp. TRM49041]|uniref:helix-turn-helix domain-containing protein n=1 Tax=Streptomyces sp. TRM49041 TaxID=2603216 RepID=UPI0011EC4E2E|nr:helix-turn-helix domain-containing protein [Streptomyces sp. TRM49041]